MPPAASSPPSRGQALKSWIGLREGFAPTRKWMMVFGELKQYLLLNISENSRH